MTGTVAIRGIAAAWARRGYRAVACLSVLGAFSATPADAEDLVELYRQAQQHDPTLEAARYARDAVGQRVYEVRAALLPGVTFTSSTNVHQNTSIHADQIYDLHQRIDVAQPLYYPDRTAAYRQAGWESQGADLQLEQAQQDLMVRVAQAYFDGLKAQDAFAAAEAQLAAMRQQLEVVERGVTAGTAAITDVQEATSRMELAKADLLAARNQVEVSRSTIRQITGFAPKRLVSLPVGAMLSAPEPVDPAPWEQAAIEGNQAVRIQQAAVEAAREEVKRMRGGHFPQFDLTATFGRDKAWNFTTNDEDEDVDSPEEQAEHGVGRKSDRTVGVQVTWNLYSGGFVNARVRGAKAKEYQAQAELETARRNAAHTALQAYSGVVNGLARITAMQRAIEASRIAVEGNKIGYRAGTRINVDVLNAQQVLYAAERDFAAARYDTLMQMLQLKAATGQLKEDDLLSINALWGAPAERAPEPDANAPP
jgi:outer membrane protein